MITDLVQIRTLGEKKRDENLRFRKHMKSRDYSDRILRRIAEEIEGRIDCTQCANCCKVATVQVSERDVARLARHLRIPAERFLAEYTVESEEEGRILRRDRESGCVFLNGRDCAVYEARPTSASAFRTWSAGTARSRAGCGSSSTAPATARSSTTRSKPSKTSCAFDGSYNWGRGSLTGCQGR